MPGLVLDALRVHRTTQERGRAEAGDNWRGVGTVFCGPDGALYFQSQLHRRFKRICRALDITGVTTHSFRHGVATWLPADGTTSIKDTQSLDWVRAIMDMLFADDRPHFTATIEVEQLPRHREVAFA